jgi:hypothetical protein
MAKSMKKLIAKSATGVAAAPARLKSEKTKVRSQAVKDNLAKARAKAQKSRSKKTAVKKASSGLSGLVTSTMDDEKDYITQYVDDNKFMISFIASVMRNGQLKQEYMKSLSGVDESKAVAFAGVRCFGEGSTKWRQFRASAAPSFLATLLNRPEIATWFKGDFKLPLSVAVKAIYFLLGVLDIPDAPTGHPLWHFSTPLLWLCGTRIVLLGNKLLDTSKDSLDNDSDFFHLHETIVEGVVVTKVMAHCWPEIVEVVLKGVAFGDSKDWMIVNGQDYLEASLVSVDAGVDSKLVRAYEKQHKPAEYDLAMTFEGKDVPNFPRNAAPLPLTPVSPSGSACVTPLKQNVPLPV